MTIYDLKNTYPTLNKDLEEFYFSKHSITVAQPSLDNLSNLIDSKIGNRKEYKRIWLNGILKKIEKETGHMVLDITLGSSPCYGGMLRFSEQNHENYISVIEVEFYVSLINDYYIIRIVEINESNTFDNIIQHKIVKRAIQNLVISPSNHNYNIYFKKIENILDNELKNSKFLPFVLESCIVDDFKLPQSINEQNTIGEALFSKRSNYKGPNILGNKNYRINDIV